MKHGFIFTGGMLRSGPVYRLAGFRNGSNNRYFPIWYVRDYRNGTSTMRNLVKKVWTEAETRYIEERYERNINAFRYSFREFQAS